MCMCEIESNRSLCLLLLFWTSEVFPPPAGPHQSITVSIKLVHLISCVSWSSLSWSSSSGVGRINGRWLAGLCQLINIAPMQSKNWILGLVWMMQMELPLIICRVYSTFLPLCMLPVVLLMGEAKSCLQPATAWASFFSLPFGLWNSQQIFAATRAENFLLKKEEVEGNTL